jgi:hypothetical protein
MSTIQTIGLGTVDNDGTGDSLKTGGDKINDNFAALNTDKAELSGATFAALCTFPDISLDNSAGINRLIRFRTSGLSRFNFYVSSESEDGSNSGSNLLLNRYDDAGNLIASVIAVTRSSGLVKMPGIYSNTTANAANIYAGSDGSILRSTSSPKFKNIMEPISIEYSKNIFEIAKKCTVFYKSKSEHDNPDWTFYGLDADKIAEIEPRLAHWGYFDENYEFVEKEVIRKVQEKNENGELIEKEVKEIERERKRKPDAKLQPTGVQYERLIPLILVEFDRQNDEIAQLRKEVDEIKKLLQK